MDKEEGEVMDQESIIKGFLNNTATVNERAMYLSLMYEQNEILSRSIDFIVVMVIKAFQVDESGEFLIEFLSNLRRSVLESIQAKIDENSSIN
jgi:hypothetical protein